MIHVCRNYLSILLKEFDIIKAHDGRDAIKILKKPDKLPDLILSGKQFYIHILFIYIKYLTLTYQIKILERSIIR